MSTALSKATVCNLSCKLHFTNRYPLPESSAKLNRASCKRTIKGVNRIVTTPFVEEGNNLGGNFSLNRLDYNVREGLILVPNLVEVTIISVLVP